MHVIIITVTRAGRPQKRLLDSREVQEDFILSKTADRLRGLSDPISNGYGNYFPRDKAVEV